MYECASCTAAFWHWVDCEEHMDDYDHWIACETCIRKFHSQRAADQHMDALDHRHPIFECETCDRKFCSQEAADQHMNALDHRRPIFECETCDRKFHSQEGAEQHMRTVKHYSNYCDTCDRWFMNENNLRMGIQHLNSKIHQGKTVKCPFCGNGFVTPSGLSHHLESASCPQARNLNQETLAEMVRRSDPHGLITQKQLESHQEKNVEYEATHAAWNGHNWECYLCHKLFKNVKSLNQHINSPTHKQKIYHCPNRRENCNKQFVSLAALFNHLESETCGLLRFRQVQQLQERLTDSFLNRKVITYI
ncbi:hypothetical protein N7462_011700 [Penicillium macrosclerotiorum]|uniref:uncharacterized protein n=1 Tax=Penicillium macrosclerotiorum TaxID=303699 RepID=UPI0025492E92|nr:uncharacterized protein N7462_011700 [Penicillium macrosclerotiorum]KAJ5662774.1 hypothetical protein N7462_011700 [Penicillium macrosclerotiorum]